MSGPLAPAVTLGVISYANSWYNTGNPANVKPLLFAGIAGLLLEGFARIPGMEPTATAIGWLAVLGMFLAPVQKPSPAENLLKITGGK
jgi:hypothetical protein